MSSSGIVLAGGRSRRMGRDKALLRCGGETLLERVCRQLARCCDEVLVVGRLDAPPGARTALDSVPGEGPLTGLIAGLTAARHPAAFVAACDLPHFDGRVAAYILSRLSEHDAAIPCVDGKPQVLHAAYHRRILPFLEERFGAGERSLRRLVPELDVIWLSEEDLRGIDSDLHSLRDTNTPEEWERLPASEREP